MSTRVLIADDAGFVRELLTRATESLGFIVVGEAVDGEEVVQMALELKPDIILMDLVMPKFNGLEATQKILEKLPETDIVACSSMDDEFILQLAQQKGCKAFLRKPFNRQSVLGVFQQLQIQKRGLQHA